MRFRLLALLLLLSTPALTSPVTLLPCNSIVNDLAPCLKFITGGDPKPVTNCCNGLKTVVGSIQSKSDKQSVCECIKSVVSGMKYDPAKVPALSKKCGVSIVLPPVTSETDCSKVSYLN